MKAMLLAAGRGSRLRPLTDTVPKPLVSVGTLRLIEYSINKLKEANINEIVINVAYLADKIIHYLGNGSRHGVTLEYSHEGEESLGTGGGVYRALTLLGNEPFWLLSADIWSNFTWFNRHLHRNACAHLVMVPNPHFHVDGDYGLTEKGIITQSTPKFTYGGIALIDPKLFSECQAGKFSLSPLFNQAITKNEISGEIYKGNWFNVGSMLELEQLREHLKKHKDSAPR